MERPQSLNGTGRRPRWQARRKKTGGCCRNTPAGSRLLRRPGLRTMAISSAVNASAPHAGQRGGRRAAGEVAAAVQ